MKKGTLRKAGLLALPAILAAGLVGSTARSAPDLDPKKCYKLTYWVGSKVRVIS